MLVSLVVVDNVVVNEEADEVVDVEDVEEDEAVDETVDEEVEETFCVVLWEFEIVVGWLGAEEEGRDGAACDQVRQPP